MMAFSVTKEVVALISDVIAVFTAATCSNPNLLIWIKLIDDYTINVMGSYLTSESPVGYRFHTSAHPKIYGS